MDPVDNEENLKPRPLHERVVTSWEDSGIVFDDPEDDEEAPPAEAAVPEVPAETSAEAPAPAEEDVVVDDVVHRNEAGQLVNQLGYPVDENGFPTTPMDEDVDEDADEDDDETYPLPPVLEHLFKTTGMIDEHGNWDSKRIQEKLPAEEPEPEVASTPEIDAQVAALEAEIARLKSQSAPK